MRGIILILLIAMSFVASCNGQNKTSQNLAAVNKLTTEEKENYPMIYQTKTLMQEELNKIEDILKKNGETMNIELFKYGGQIHRFLFVSYEVKKEFVVLDEHPSAHHYRAIVDTKNDKVLPNSEKTLALIFQTVDIFNNRELSDEDILSLISQTLFGGKLLTEEYQLSDESELPSVKRDGKSIKCTAYLRVADSGMTMPRSEKQTITIDKEFNITVN